MNQDTKEQVLNEIDHAHNMLGRASALLKESKESLEDAEKIIESCKTESVTLDDKYPVLADSEELVLTPAEQAPEGRRLESAVLKRPDKVDDKPRQTYPIPTYLATDSKFKFGRKSEHELLGVKRELVEVARLALKHTTQDFMIFDGLRTTAEQRNIVALGVSKTMRSKHLPQADGFSHALDAVPVNSAGAPKWDWDMVYPVICAFDFAATQLGYDDHIRWGGAWDRVLSDFGGETNAYRLEVEAYAKRHVGKDFLDGPHLEWVS